MCAPAAPTVDSLHAKFLALLPRIERCLTVYFRDVRCEDRKRDCIAEAVALAWKWFIALVRRGKDAAEFVSVLAGYAARAVCSGRRVCGQEKARDVMSATAQRKHGFRVEPLPASTRVALEHLYATPHGQQRLDALEEALQDNTRSPVADQVCFRLDFPRWRLSRSERDRRVVDDLMVGERTHVVARKYGLTPSRISQLRAEFCHDWQRFCGDVDDEMERVPAQEERRP